MAHADPIPQLNDQSFALQLQLREIEAQRDLQTGKWTHNNAPDFSLAFDDFEAEVQREILLVEDLKFAHSVAKAVDDDARAIEESQIEEAQSAQDRQFALGLNENDDPLLQGDTQSEDRPGVEINSTEWDSITRLTEAPTASTESCSTVAGPSTRHVERQRTVLDRLSQLKVDCIVCGDCVHPHAAVRLSCGDVYCKPCLKAFFLRVTKDESLFPPKCHRQSIDISIIEADFSDEEIIAYRSAEEEFTSTDRVYCADPNCAKFIPKSQRTPEYASCDACKVKTCMHCKGSTHEGDCPADEARQNLIQFAEEQGWKSCFGCGAIVFRHKGCDHMTCRCSAEFCYRCGVKWKECECDDWEPELLDQRAEQVVDREAIMPLEPAVRQQRVVAMARELQTNHECNHSGRFERLGGSRRGWVCEICGARHWKYILSCRRCHMLACEDCRRHRVIKTH